MPGRLDMPLLKRRAHSRSLGYLFCASTLIASLPAHAAGREVLVGVNVTGVQRLDQKQQDALIQDLKSNGVKLVRTGIGDNFSNFLIHASQNGIQAVVIVYPSQGDPNARLRPANKPLGLEWAEACISSVDPGKFKTWFAARLDPLEAAGVRLAGFEVGNEINGPFFNGDFLPEQASGRVLGEPDLKNPKDPEGQAIAASYRAYLRIVAAVKDVRDHSKLNRATPIISAGLADGGSPRKNSGQKLDGVSIPDTLDFWRENGLDDLVDDYGVHFYPSNLDPNVPASVRANALAERAFARCTRAKPCWLTEWGFPNRDPSCPIHDETRKKLIETERQAFKAFIDQGRLAAVIYYNWTALSGFEAQAIFRCGALTEAGKLAISPP
jgi:hypothetical protein